MNRISTGKTSIDGDLDQTAKRKIIARASGSRILPTRLNCIEQYRYALTAVDFQECAELWVGLRIGPTRCILRFSERVFKVAFYLLNRPINLQPGIADQVAHFLLCTSE